MSGKDFDSPVYARMMASLKPGCLVVVKSLDRLGRDYDEMLRQIEIIEGKGASIAVLDLPGNFEAVRARREAKEIPGARPRGCRA